MTTVWGVLGAAGIARKMFLPAMMQLETGRVKAIASRSSEKGQALAEQFDVPQVYGDYESLLRDPEIDAVYIPLPNAQHVDATLKVLAAGKHVLCEKPIALRADEIATIASAAKAASRHAVEGFMVAYHPQWQKVRDWISAGEIGSIQRVEGVFSYYLDDSTNIRNRADGGALRDIGVYPVFVTRLITGQEPKRVLGQMRRDASAESDIHTSAWMEFDGFDAGFYVSSRADGSQTMTIYGTHGRIEVRNAFNPPNSGEQQIHLFKGNELKQTATFSDVFQFALQLDHLSKVFAGQGEPLVSLENSAANQRVLDAIIRSDATQSWQLVE